jgi:hypothetical protein
LSKEFRLRAADSIDASYGIVERRIAFQQECGAEPQFAAIATQSKYFGH